MDNFSSLYATGLCCMKFESLRTLKYRSWRNSILSHNILGLKIENFRVRLIMFPLVQFRKILWSV